MTLICRNPHSVLAALKERPSDVLKLTTPQTGFHPSWNAVYQAASQTKIPLVKAISSTQQDSRTYDPKRMGRQGLAEAEIREKSPVSLETLFSGANASPYGLWLALDQLQDPHNVGAIFRSAAFFGIRGILLTQHHTTTLTSTVYDVASGGIEYVPFSVQNNLQQALQAAKNQDVWVLGASEHAQDNFRSIPQDRSWILVLGNEETGMRRLTTENCDMLCSIPPAGPTTSLNVSVAAGVLMSWLTRPVL
jgi:23S rRNA (guanosine2251-2'-O)-methyltransferase